VIPLKDENPTTRTPVVTFLLIAACVGIYFFWQPSPAGETDADTVFLVERASIPCEVLQGRPLSIDEAEATYRLGDPEACGVGDEDEAVFPDKSPWLAVLVSIFLHGSIIHLAGNMLFLWVFGNNVEDHLGIPRYIGFYLIGGVVASFAHFALNPDSTVPVVGASGAIAAVMGAYMVWWPEARVRTLVIAFFFFFVRIRAKWLLGFWFVLQFATSPNSGVAWAAHVGGFVFGVLVALVVRRSATAQRAAFRSSYGPVDSWDPTGGTGYSDGADERRFGGRRW
jgi:membrane associated rhomboid family serine protease